MYSITMFECVIYALLILLIVRYLLIDILMLFCFWVKKTSSEARNTTWTVVAMYIMLRLFWYLFTFAAFLPKYSLDIRYFAFACTVHIGSHVLFRAISWVCLFIHLRTHYIASFTKTTSGTTPETTESSPRLPLEPMVLVIIPCHMEGIEVLYETIRCVLGSDYPPDRVHVFVSFDGYKNEEIYQRIATEFRCRKRQDIDTAKAAIAAACYNGFQFTVSMFEHGGKAHVLGKTLDYVRQYLPQYVEDTSNTYVFILDSDTTVPRNTITEFSQKMQSKPYLKGMAPVSGIKQKQWTLSSALQEVDYFYVGVCVESVMSYFGATACLSGNALFTRLNVLLDIPAAYFQSSLFHSDTLQRYWSRVLGDDRWLTYLIISQSFEYGVVDMHSGIVSETEPAEFLTGLLNQRRRWFLGDISVFSEVISSPAFWARYPVQATYRLLRRTIDIELPQEILLVLFLILRTSTNTDWMIMAISRTFVVEWGILLGYAYMQDRPQVILYPLYSFIIPFWQLFVAIYTIWTLEARTWGGHRSD